jgi:hypothetical protein
LLARTNLVASTGQRVAWSKAAGVHVNNVRVADPRKSSCSKTSDRIDDGATFAEEALPCRFDDWRFWLRKR